MKYRMTLSRVYEFSSAHRLHAGQLSDEQNVQVYDKCNNPQGHGHDYRLEISLQGEPASDTGMICDLGEMDSRVRKVLDQLDYRHLNYEVEFFKTHISTGEIIIQFLWDELSRQFQGSRLYYLKLWETSNNYFELGGTE